MLVRWTLALMMNERLILSDPVQGPVARYQLETHMLVLRRRHQTSRWHGWNA